VSRSSFPGPASGRSGTGAGWHRCRSPCLGTCAWPARLQPLCVDWLLVWMSRGCGELDGVRVGQVKRGGNKVGGDSNFKGLKNGGPDKACGERSEFHQKAQNADMEARNSWWGNAVDLLRLCHPSHGPCPRLVLAYHLHAIDDASTFCILFLTRLSRHVPKNRSSRSRPCGISCRPVRC